MSKLQHRPQPYRGKRRNVGAYERPFSGVGMEFEPLGAPPADTGFVLHETGYWAHNRAWDFPSVYSPFWRIYYDFEPAHHVRFGKRLTPLGPDRVLVIPDHQRFDCLGDTPVASLWFAFSCSRNADPWQQTPIVIPASDTTRAFAAEFPLLWRKQQRERLFRLSLSFVLYILSQPQIVWQAPLPEYIAKILAMVNHNPAGPWTSSRLAAKVHMSVDGFARSFRQWMHTTPIRYVQQVRIREACRLLSDSNESIKKIAVCVGFANRHHFSRVFKAQTGTTPALYRKQNTGSFNAGAPTPESI